MSREPSTSAHAGPAPMTASRPAGTIASAWATLRWMVGALRYSIVRVRPRLLLEAKVEDLPRVPPSIPVRYRFGGVNDLERLREVRPDYDEAAKRVTQEALARGDWFILGEHNGRAVFSMWVMRGAIHTGRRRVWPIRSKRAYSYWLYTAASARGQGVATGAYQFLAPALMDAGYHRLVCWVSDRNTASMRMHARVGFVPVARLYEVRLIRWKTYWPGTRLRRLVRSTTP